MSIWLPDWPVTAAGFGVDEVAAVMGANRVIARTAAAAADGVVIGQRRRQAQRRCPHLTLVDRDADRDAREFEPIVRAVAELSPRLDVVEPGWISLLARGPARYFGGDRSLADRLSERLAEAIGAAGTPVAGVGIGVADGRFASSVAARLAARRAEAVIVEPGRVTGVLCRPSDRLVADAR